MLLVKGVASEVMGNPILCKYNLRSPCLGVTASCGSIGTEPPGPSLKGDPGGSPLNICLKDQYTAIEQSNLDTLIEQSQYSSEEQCNELINKEIWLVRGSYCHCVVIQNGNLLALGALP